jgi:hypothetical protein
MILAQPSQRSKKAVKEKQQEQAPVQQPTDEAAHSLEANYD